MKKLILLFFAIFFAIDLLQAQDTIVPKDKTKSRLIVVLTKVSQEPHGTVEYKDYNNQEGPTYTMPWNQINMIRTIDGATIYPPVEEEIVLPEKEKNIVMGVVAGMNMSNFNYKYSGSFVGSVLNYGYDEELGEEPNYQSVMGYSFGASLDIKLVNNFFLKTGLVYSNHKVVNNFNGTYEFAEIYTDGIYIGYLVGYMYDRYEENYILNYLNVPILASYRLPLTKTKKMNIQFNVGLNVGIGLSGKLRYSGYNTSDGHNLAFIDYESGNIIDYYGIDSYYEGDVDLFSGNGEYDYTNITGSFGSEDINCDNPYKRINLGLNFGFDVEFIGINLGFSYTLGINNYANKNFWNNKRVQVSEYTGNSVKDYKQSTNSFNITLGYKFR